MPITTFTFIPDLHALIAGAGRHPPPVEVERDIVDEILVVRRDAASHKHGFRRARASEDDSGGGGARPTASPDLAARERTARAAPAPAPPLPIKPRPTHGPVQPHTVPWPLKPRPGPGSS